MWSLLEVDVAIIASCVPAIKAMFVTNDKRGGTTRGTGANPSARSARSGRSANNDLESGKLSNGKREVVGKDGSVELTVTTSVSVTNIAKDDASTLMETDEEG
jgi:hypothetical protein